MRILFYFVLVLFLVLGVESSIPGIHSTEAYASKNLPPPKAKIKKATNPRHQKTHYKSTTKRKLQPIFKQVPKGTRVNLRPAHLKRQFKSVPKVQESLKLHKLKQENRNKVTKKTANSEITASSRKRLKRLVKNISQNRLQNNGLSQKKVDQLRRIVEKSGATLRNDAIAGVKGSSAAKPHVQTEGLGKSIDSRHIWTQKGIQ